VNTARNERDRLALWSRVLPITFTASGAIALISGLLLGWFSLRTEAALLDPGLDNADHGFFNDERAGEQVPGAEAMTEILPAQRDNAQHDSGPPDTGPPSSGGSLNSGPPNLGPPDRL
jgi:hypothetical protein